MESGTFAKSLCNFLGAKWLVACREHFGDRTDLRSERVCAIGPSAFTFGCGRIILRRIDIKARLHGLRFEETSGLRLGRLRRLILRAKPTHRSGRFFRGPLVVERD